MQTYLSKRLLAAHMALTAVGILSGVTLVASAQALRLAPPPFDGVSQTPAASWHAFNGGLSALGVALIGLAVAAGWRTVNAWRSRDATPAPRDGKLFGKTMSSGAAPYFVRVGLCLAAAIGLIALPVLLVGGAPAALLSPFSVPLTVVCLVAGGLVGAIRR
jgi:hypothetical protein